jgi:hypothetical protein
MVAETTMAKRWWPFTRHKCPPTVTLEVIINDETIIGPVSSIDLAYMRRYNGEPYLNLLDGLIGDIHSLEMRIY